MAMARIASGAGPLRWSRKFGQVVKLGSPLRRTDPMTGKRKRYSAEFKAKVALEAMRGELTTAQLATKHGVHQTMVSEWKRQAMEGLAAVFSGKAEAKAKSPGRRGGEAARQDRPAGGGAGFFGESLRSMSVDRRRTMIEPGSPAAVDRAAVRAGLDQPRRRSTAQPAAETAENLALMRLHRRAVPGDAWYGVAADGAASAAPGLMRRPQAGAAADGQDGPGADLSAAEDDGAAPASTGSIRICCGIW